MENLEKLVLELIKYPKETEWIEFKENNRDPEAIGEYISALSNSATLHNKEYAYVIWGINDSSHEITGTIFDYNNTKVGNEELKNWLYRMTTQNINFDFDSVMINNKKVVVLKISKAIYMTTKFRNIEYVRVGSYKKQLKDYPQIEAQLWNKINTLNYEDLVAIQDLNINEIFQKIDYASYFDLLKLQLPNIDSITKYLIEDNIIIKQDNGLFSITNLGAILFAKNLEDFNNLSRKAIRIIQYEGKDRAKTIREYIIKKGYASCFEDLVLYIENISQIEKIEGPLREKISKYPNIVIRELIANLLIHQDFSISGTGVTIEIFDNSIEFTNPGTPLVDRNRFIDNPPRSRNEKLASFMRRINICEERGSGWDKIILFCEKKQIPAPKIQIYKESTKIYLYSFIPFNKLSHEEKLWSCYMHTCLKYVCNERMTNNSLRERFGLKVSNKASVSRLIKEAVSKNIIKPLDPYTAPRYISYIPYWA